MGDVSSLPSRVADPPLWGDGPYPLGVTEPPLSGGGPPYQLVEPPEGVGRDGTPTGSWEM